MNGFFDGFDWRLYIDLMTLVFVFVIFVRQSS